MSELEEKLNALLSDPQSMAQVMQMARQLSGGMEDRPPQPAPQSAPPPTPAPADPGPLAGLDPRLLSRFLPLLGEMNADSQTMQLLLALRPFLKEEKRDKIERAARLARLIHVGKTFLSEWEG